MMLKGIRWWLGSLVLAALVSCGGGIGSSGSNSNWVTCNTDADCPKNGDPLSCVDGYCRASMAVDTGTTGSSTAGTGSFDASGATGSSSNDSGAAPSCEEQSTAISAHITAAAEGADKSCTSDSDCTYIETFVTSCDTSCGSGAVSLAGAASIENALASIERDLCSTYEASACPRLGPPPCHSPSSVACQAGQCVPGDAIGYSPPTCGQLTTIIADRITQVENAADTRCTTDADCTALGRSTNCYASCSTRALSTSGAESVRQVIEDINANGCESFVSMGCPRPIPPPCVFQGSPACDNGACTLKLP